MLGNARVETIIPVTDLDRSAKFYGDTLGLKKVALPMPGYVRYEAGSGTSLTLYARGETKTEHTLAGFTVPSLADAMKEMRGKGITFEEYDFPGFKTVNGVFDAGGIKTAWFKDPDGNILCIDEVH
jgi:catechol 2,3-dioxygenase-like lactoylglutathione lyase family enzyme